MARLQKELNGAPVRLVTITVDPRYDTPAVLKNYADDVAADSDRWLFLTGEPDYVYQVLRENFRQFVREETGENRKPGYEVAHEASVLHIDAKGRIAGTYLGSNDGEMVRLRMALLKEAKQLAENPPTAETAPEPAVAETPETRRKGDR
jgi:protein SCO1/2